MGMIINPYRFGSGFIMPSGLVVRWEMNGNANDSSGNGYNLTNTDAVLTTDRNAASDKAYDFNGSSAFMTYDKTPFALTDKFTICFWYKADAIGGCILGLTELSSNGGWYLRLNSDKIYFHYIGYWYSVNISTSDTSNWHFVCASFDKDASSNQIKLQLDNGTAVVATKTTSIIYSSDQGDFLIGKVGWGAGGYFNGKIDQVLFFNRELTAAEKTSIYNYYL